MTTWLIDTALLKALGSPHAARLKHWVEAHDASLFLSAASLTEIAAAISKMPASQPQKSAAMRKWFDQMSTQFADRIHAVDAEIATRAGALLPSIRNGLPRHRFHDAILLATAQVNGHSLLTRRDGVLGSWASVPIVTL